MSWSQLYPLRIDARSANGYRLVDTILLSASCLPKPLSAYRTTEEGVEANVRALADSVITDFEVQALQPAGYRLNYYSGRESLLNLPQLRADVEHQIRTAVWKLVDDMDGVGVGGSVSGGSNSRKRKSEAPGGTAAADKEDDSGADTDAEVSKKQKSQDDQAPAAVTEATETADDDQPRKETGAETETKTNTSGDTAEKAPAATATNDAPKRSGGDESTGTTCTTTSTKPISTIDKSDLVKIRIRLRYKRVVVLDEFYVDPSFPTDLPGGDLLSIAKSLVKDLNLPEAMTTAIVTTIIEQCSGLEVPPDIDEVKPPRDGKVEPSRETPSAFVVTTI